MKLSKKEINFAVILILFLLAFYVKYGPQGFSLVHDTPTTTSSSDAIFHALETEWIAEDGRHLHMAPYLATGKHDVYDGAPPQLYIGAAFFTLFGGIESYDSIFLLAALMFAAAVASTYLLLSRYFGRPAAIFASVLIILPLETAFFYMTNIGWYHQIASIVFFPFVPYLLYSALK